MSNRERLVAFYQRHNPAKLGEVDALLETFAGREESMFAALRQKYGEAASTVRSVTAAPGAPTTEANAVHAEMRALLADMESVDLTRLLSQLKGQATVESDLLAHTLTFMQHFATCAQRFQALSGDALQRLQAAPEAPGPAVPAAVLAAGEDVATQTEPTSTGRRDAAVAAGGAATVSVGTQADTDTEKVRGVPSAAVSPTSEPELTHAAATPPMYHPDAGALRADMQAAVAPAALNVDAELDQQRRIGTVHRLKPVNHKKAEVIGALLAAGGLADTDSVTLEPGVYHENLRFVDSGAVEVVAVFPGAPVIIKPLSSLEPIIRAEGGRTRLRLSGVVLVESDLAGGAPAELPAAKNPLVAVTDGAHVEFHGCHLYQGSCAVEATGPSTEVSLHLSLISSCTFAGLFLRLGATAAMTQCKVKLCEAGVRVASQSSLHARETVVEGNTTDGIVAYEGAEGKLERSSVLRNGGNGLFLSSGATFMVAESTVELNGLYGIQRLQSSGLHLRDSVVRDNALLPINDAEETVNP
ncbi:uncharacterized protein Tco025E_05843 [Trypanosoma conorhini]|uniref:Right handed beta helix domain-containing protein n=1 Tax=Trypanosoma conorhini TaxID=83891 RepID=A0A3R7NZC4_9TRYP|nr:uncharacterized protein Tco025E_05843 [Trypanosoma conorhini]RNF14438.1 hypothetical protein Tco025E_05843 [Trypanosoma conorhini]